MSGREHPDAPSPVTAELIEREPELVLRVVRAYVRAVAAVVARPDEAASLAAPLIGVHERFVAASIASNPPRVEGIRHDETMRRILSFMQELGYVDRIPEGFIDGRFMDAVLHDGLAG